MELTSMSLWKDCSRNGARISGNDERRPNHASGGLGKPIRRARSREQDTAKHADNLLGTGLRHTVHWEQNDLEVLAYARRHAHLARDICISIPVRVFASRP
jgi:hypothetical protein